MHLKSWLKALLLFLPMSSQASYLCSVTSENYPGFEDGLVLSKEVEVTGPQGVSSGHVLLDTAGDYEFRIVAGRLLKLANQSPVLIDFYTEIKDLKSGLVMRSKSGDNGGSLQARTELVAYPEDSLFYKSILIFDCKQY